MHTPGYLLADGLNSLTRGPARADLRPLKGTVGREAALGTGAGLCSSSAPWPGPCCRRGPGSPVCWQPRFHRHRRRCHTPMAPSPGACERQLLPQLPLRSRGRWRSLGGSRGRQLSLAPAEGSPSDGDWWWAPAASLRSGCEWVRMAAPTPAAGVSRAGAGSRCGRRAGPRTREQRLFGSHQRLSLRTATGTPPRPGAPTHLPHHPTEAHACRVLHSHSGGQHTS